MACRQAGYKVNAVRRDTNLVDYFSELIGMVYSADSVPPVLTPRAPPSELQGLAGTALAPSSPYRYVLLDIWIITITRRSIALAVAASTLSFTTFQVSVD